MNGRSLASGLIGVLVGCGIGIWVGGWQHPRYQAVQLEPGFLVRLDTQTGELRVFAPIKAIRRYPDYDPTHLLSIGRSLEGHIDASDVKIVTDARVVERCEYLGDTLRAANLLEAAERGGDTLLRGKETDGTEQYWVYRCKAR